MMCFFFLRLCCFVFGFGVYVMMMMFDVLLMFIVMFVGVFGMCVNNCDVMNVSVVCIYWLCVVNVDVKK